MTFKEFEKAKKTDLQKAAKNCFEKANAFSDSWDGKAPYLLEAQFYMAELDRRSSGWIATRDLVLELVVILLIGWGIVEGNKQATVLDKQLTVLNTIQTNAATQADRDKVLMDKQNAILGNLQRASDATAEAMKNLVATSEKTFLSNDATAKTLRALQATTEKMNQGVHDQLALFYDPSISFNFDSEANRIVFMNTGRSNLTIKSVSVNSVVLRVSGAMLLSVGSNYYVNQPELYKTVEKDLRKGLARTIPVEAHIQNELEKPFVLRGGLYFVWENDKLTVHSQPSSITAER